MMPSYFPGGNEVLDKTDEDYFTMKFKKHDYDEDGTLNIIEAQRLLSPTNV